MCSISFIHVSYIVWSMIFLVGLVIIVVAAEILQREGELGILKEGCRQKRNVKKLVWFLRGGGGGEIAPHLSP